MAWYVGLMSGTSLDGVDGVLARDDAGSGLPLKTAAHASVPMPETLRAELLALNRSGADELHRAALAANALSELYALTVARLLAAAGIASTQVSAIGAHGQTVRHRPQAFDGVGYTLQLVNGALLAERTGIAVVCDFRSRDLAAGGQGAPLVPAFHAACFARPGADIAVLNLGGIANLSLLRASGEVLGFDCGPGNLLMDLWCRRHLGTAYDADGAWAAGGHVGAGLLERLLAEPFLALAPPKSTGRDLFDAGWLDDRLGPAPPSPQDVMATLAEFTARGAVDALRRHAPATHSLLVCGGGAFNSHLMTRLAQLLAGAMAVCSTGDAGLPPDQVEALAFAWLAKAHLERRSGNLPAVTGARAARVLGALYPAG
ncbi:MAG TPA: anhydro-N-acetylmuramic acid kinase [Rubrivivax sp.]|nr:anhydro-N-acetylmuramic acid kinase [Rubrivivax sp.]